MTKIAAALALIIIVTGWSMLATGAAETPNRAVCLSRSGQRAAIEARRAIPLAEVLRRLEARGIEGEAVRARLCRRGDGLAYMLTLLGQNGKVVAVTVDAANGALINGR